MFADLQDSMALRCGEASGEGQQAAAHVGYGCRTIVGNQMRHSAPSMRRCATLQQYAETA